MNFVCKIEPAEYRRAAWIHMKPRRSFAVVGLALVGLALFVFAFGINKFLATGTGEAVILALGVALAYLALYFYAWFPRRLNRLYEQQKLLHSEFEVEISNEFFITRSVHGNSKLPWSIFCKWKSGGDLVLLYQSDALFHLFPSRCFPTPEDFERFQKIQESHLGPARA